MLSPVSAQRREAIVQDVLIQEVEAIGLVPGGELGAPANSRPQLIKQMRGLIQNELSIIGDICNLSENQQQALADMAESEWKAKTSASITKRTQENTYGLVDLDGLAERVVRSWLQAIATAEQLAKYDDELADRMRWRQKAVISKMLDTYESKLNLSGVQMEQIESRLNEKWKDRFYKSLEATFDSSLLPEIRPAWISDLLSEAQRAALVTREQPLQRSFIQAGWQDTPGLEVHERFKVGKVQSGDPKTLKPIPGKSKTLEKIDAIIDKAKAEDEGTFDDKNLDGFRPSPSVLRLSSSAKSILLIPYLLVVVLGSLAIGQEEAANEAEIEVQFNAGAVPRMNRAQLEEYMYNSLGGSKAAFHRSKREAIRRDLDRVNSICELTESQWSKLNEAIEVDIQHMETKITSLMSGYDGKMTPQVLQDMQSKIWQFATSLQAEQPDPNMVWRKVLFSQLTKEQTVKLEADEKKKLENGARTQRLRILLSLQRKLGLNAVQRGKIDGWLSQSNHHELQFHMICAELAKSDLAKEILRADQVQLLEKSAPIDRKHKLQMNPILPRNDILR